MFESNGFNRITQLLCPRSTMRYFAMREEEVTAKDKRVVEEVEDAPEAKRSRRIQWL
jgi:hypothetical protein